MDAIQCFALQDAQGCPLVTAGMTLRDAQNLSPTSSTRPLTQENMQDVFPTRPDGVVLAFGRLVSHTSNLVPILESLLGDYLPIELKVITLDGVFDSSFRDFLLFCLSRKTPKDLNVHVIQTVGDSWKQSKQPDITYSFGFGVYPSYSQFVPSVSCPTLQCLKSYRMTLLLRIFLLHLPASSRVFSNSSFMGTSQMPAPP